MKWEKYKETVKLAGFSFSEVCTYLNRNKWYLSNKRSGDVVPPVSVRQLIAFFRQRDLPELATRLEKAVATDPDYEKLVGGDHE